MTFLDAAGLVALHLTRDAGHAEAMTAWHRILRAGGVVTSNMVLAETATIIGRRAGYVDASRIVESYYANRDVRILRPTESDERQAVQLMRKYADQRISMVDCISFQLMRTHGIKQVFTFDRRHFTIAGFTVCP